QERRNLPPKLIAFSVRRRQAHLLDEGAIARVGMEEVEGWVGLYPQLTWRVLPVTFLEKRKGVLAVAKLGVESRQVTGRNIMGLFPISKAVQFPLHHGSVSAAFEGK